MDEDPSSDSRREGRLVSTPCSSRSTSVVDISVTSDKQRSSDDSDGELESIKKKAKIRVSAVHEEFNRVMKVDKKGKEDEFSLCKHCNSEIRGKNSTNLNKHLDSKHPAIAVKVKKANKEIREELTKNKASTPESSSHKTSASSVLLMNFVGLSEKTTPRPVAKDKISLKATALWIGGSCLPLSAVEDPGYERVLKTYDKQVK